MITVVRNHCQRLARIHLGLFLALWLGIVIAPCAMAHVADDQGQSVHHDCPHCPPKPCHQQAEPADCDDTEPADRLRSVDSSQFIGFVPVEYELIQQFGFYADRDWPASVQHARDGPRPYLLYQRFQE